MKGFQEYVRYPPMLEQLCRTFAFWMSGNALRYPTETRDMTLTLPINAENSDLRPSASIKVSHATVPDVPDIAKSKVLMERDRDCSFSLRARHRMANKDERRKHKLHHQYHEIWTFRREE
jgi:hypothetical protein